MVTYAAEETRDPERTIPRALMLGTAVVVVIYLALNSAYLLVLPFDRVLASTHIAYDATLATAGPAAASAISVLVIVSSFGAMSGIILAGPRVYYAMAEDGLLFKWMGAVHPRHRTPYVAIADAGDLVVGPGADRHLRRDRLARHLHRMDLLCRAGARDHARCAAAVGYAPAFRAWGFPVVPILFALVCAAIVVNQIASRSAREPDRPRARCRRPAGLLVLETHRCPCIDFHNHYYPPRYMKALQSGESSVRVTVDSDGNPNLHYPGDYNVAVRGHRDLAYRAGGARRAWRRRCRS